MLSLWRKHNGNEDGNGSQDTNGKNPVLTGYTSVTEEPTLPAIIPVQPNGEVFWAFLDTGSGRNFISREAAKRRFCKSVSRTKTGMLSYSCSVSMETRRTYDL